MYTHEVQGTCMHVLHVLYNYISKDFWPGWYGAKYKYYDLPVYMIHPRDWQNVFVKTGIQ